MQTKYLINLNSKNIEQQKLYLKSKKKLLKVFKIISKHLPKRKIYEISLNFVTNEEIRKLNKKYRTKDKVTDVLSFVQMDDFDEELILGDVFINYDFLIEEYEFDFEKLQEHFIFLFIHSLLHLVGFDHKKDIDWKKMVLEEEKILKTINKDI